MGNWIYLDITEDMLKLISLLSIKRISATEVGIDTSELYDAPSLYDYMAIVLGLEEHKIEGTENNSFGAEYDEETTNRIKEVDDAIVNNIQYIEEIVHQFAATGVKVGKYKRKNYSNVWTFEG